MTTVDNHEKSLDDICFTSRVRYIYGTSIDINIDTKLIHSTCKCDNKWRFNIYGNFSCVFVTLTSFVCAVVQQQLLFRFCSPDTPITSSHKSRVKSVREGVMNKGVNANEAIPAFEVIQTQQPVVPVSCFTKKRINPFDYENPPNAGPRPDQHQAIGWFETQGWKDRWPLQYAAMKGDVLSIIRLVENENVSPDVKMTDWYDSQAVGWAASFGQLGALRCLVDLGADPMVVNKANNTALTDAKREKHEACIEYMEAYVRDNPAVNTSELYGETHLRSNTSPSSVNLDFRSYSNPPGVGPRPDQLQAITWFEGRGWKSRWPLQYAAMKGDVESIIDLVRGQGVPVNVKMTEWFDSQAVGWAASFGQVGALRCLVDLGADPMVVNKANNTALSDANRENHRACIAYLEEYIRKNEIEVFGENYARICFPIAGHPDFDKGAYYHPIGCCCYTPDRHKEDVEPATWICCPLTLACWLGTLCYQPCGIVCAHKFPWFGDCICSEQRVTNAFARRYRVRITKGPDKL